MKNELPERYNLGARIEDVIDGDTVRITAEFPFGLMQMGLTIRFSDIDAAETYTESGPDHTEFAEEWFATAEREHDGLWPLIFDSQEWDTGGFGRPLGYLYRRSDGAEYNEDFLEAWGEEYRYQG